MMKAQKGKLCAVSVTAKHVNAIPRNVNCHLTATHKHTQTDTTTLYLDVAVGVEQHVGRLDVSVQQVGGVQVLEGFQQLPDDVFLVDVRQDARTNHGVQVCANSCGKKGDK